MTSAAPAMSKSRVRAGVGDVGGEHPAVRGRRSGSTAPTSRPCRGPASPGTRRQPAVARAARRTWWPRSTGRGRGRSGPARAGRWPAWRELVAAAGGAPVLPDDGPVAGPAAPARSQATAVSRWLVMPRAATDDPGRRERDRRPRPGWPARRPDLVGVVLDPARAGEVLGELAVGEVDAPSRPRRPPGSGPRWCRRRRPPRAPSAARYPSPVAAAGPVGDLRGGQDCKPSRTARHLGRQQESNVDSGVTTVL